MSLRNHPSVPGAFCGVVLSGLALVAMFGGITCTAVAGDLLRGGYTNSQSGGGSAPGSFTPPSLVKARQNARDVLARTTQAIDAVMAMQNTARKLALRGANNLGSNPNNPAQTLPNVTNGLNTGGLVPDSGIASAGVANPVTTWTGANTPIQSITSKGQTVVTVNQTAPDAILNWSSFNIGKQTTLDINQGLGGSDESKWIAFNIISDPSAVPSQILGSIQAGGQVYVINQNGIIFGGSSQVNVHTLVASSLPIDTYLIGHGLLNNPDDQFLFSAVAQPAGGNGSPAFTPPTSFLPDGADGDVIVQAGAQLTAPANAASVGGRVALIGPNVDNAGMIYTPDGQTILAAGLQVGFIASSDPTLRGLDAFVGEVTDPSYPTTATAGLVTNSGMIYVPRGDAYLTGETVDQLGAVASTTSVTLNGRIDLLANYDSISGGGTATAAFLPQSAGAVVLGPDSVTDILPETNSSDTVTLSGYTLTSEVNLQGETIHMEGNATLLAPSAAITANAGTWIYQNEEDTFINSGGQIYMDSGAVIDAEGSWDVQASVTQNIISLQLLGPELADSPSQRNGALAGQTIYVDVRDNGTYDGESWIGTPLVDDVSSFAALIDYTIGELTINGGTVKLNAGGSVVMQPGSEVNVSGGWIDYQGGVVSTSEVISGGHVYPISEATPDLVYQGFNLGTFTVDHPTYGINQTFTDPILALSHYEDSYVNGGNGGVVSITSPSVALDGEFLGLTVYGPRQQSINTTTENSLTMSSFPTASAFSLAFEEQQTDYPAFNEFSPTPPKVVFSDDDTLPAAAPFAVDSSGNPLPLSTARQDEVILSPDLFSSDGFGSLTLNNGDGDVIIPSNVTLDLAPGGGVNSAGYLPSGITVMAANVDIDGSIFAPGGTLSFTVYDSSPYAQLLATPPLDPTRGHFFLGSDSTLSTAGMIVDNREFTPDADTLPLATSGGKISIKSLSANLSAGSVLDVSGGVEMTTNGTPDYGNAGSITVSAGKDPGVGSLIGGTLTLDADLEGFSGAKGGSLSILAPMVQIGGVAPMADALTISPDFFDTGGFASFSLSGLGGTTSQEFDFIPGLEIAPGTLIDPVITSLVAMPDSGGIRLVQATLPVGVRSPVSLAFGAPGVSDSFPTAPTPLVIRGDLVMGAGSVIKTDPLATVGLTGQSVAVLGSVIDPGGSIDIEGAGNSANLFASGEGVPTVDLGPKSLLSTAGVTVLTANPLGYRTGTVLNGGSIDISGNIVAESGAVLDVSGASSILDVTPVQANVNAAPGGSTESVQNGSFLGMLLVPAEVDSNGGAITLAGSQELFTDATLEGAAGGPAAIGGLLTISSGSTSPQSPVTPTVIITQSGPTIPGRFYPPGQDAIGHSVGPAPMGYFTADAFNDGGFNSLVLEGSVQFDGPVTLNAPGSLIVATGGVIFANAAVNLNASYVALGLGFQPPTQAQFVTAPFFSGGTAFYFDPTYGPGKLNVTADLIDIGSLSLQNIGSANFIANGGDIRGDGTLDVAGSVYMKAGQVYVPTEVNFTIAVYDKNVVVASSQAGSTSVTLNSATLPPGFGVGSPLLGSTVQSIDGTMVTLASGASTTVTAPTPEDFAPGSGTVTFAGSGERDLPLSAGGTLDVYASTINQDGVLRAPFGTINLGWDGSGTAPLDAITGQAVDVTQTLTLGKGSITSVSGVDPLTGLGLIVPYGTNPDGTSWLDPSGLDITAGGVPQKSITVAALNVADDAGAILDIKGGGDLLSYQFSPGIGGNNDILGSDSSFAILPGYQADYAPFDSEYSNASLAPGDQVYLNGSGVLAAGDYTLLPARYALLPGAILLTPQSGLPAGASQILPDGGSLVSGYQFGFGQSRAPLTTSFELDSAAVFRTFADYTVYSGNTYLANGAALNSQKIPRLPKDSGELSFQAVDSLGIAGTVESTPLAGGLGGLVDIASPEDIVIAGPGVTQSDALVLTANELSSFGAASLLIGGTRETGAAGVTVNVETANITIDNSGDPLTGSDIILACTDALTLDPGAEIEASGAASGAESIAVAGNGALVRVSSDPTATVTRTGVTTTTQPELTIGAGAKLTGGSVTLDSSSGTDLDPNAIIHAKSVALNSGQISVELTNPGSNVPTPTATSGLILAGPALEGLFASAESLSLLSYSSIDFYGTGQLGDTNADGQAVLKNFTLSAGEIRGFNSTGGDVTIAARTIRVENAAGGTDPGAAADTGGSLVLDGDTIAFGANTMAIDQFTTVDMNASAGMIATASTGAVAVKGDLNLTTPFITGEAGVAESISTPGALTIAAPADSLVKLVSGGLAASLKFIGGSVTDNSEIKANSGSITIEATTGDLDIGNLAAASLDVSGEAKKFFNLTRYTNAGQINLIADQGNVSVGADTTLSVAAQSGGGNAGTLSVSDPNGTLSLAGNLSAQGGAGGQSGSFSLDVGSLPTLAALDATLNAGDFDQSRTIEVRTGNVLVNDVIVTNNTGVTHTDDAVAADFNLSADAGDITVSGEIDGSGQMGGSITLQAEGSVTLLSTAVLTVAAQNFNDAQRGGSVDLEAGSEVNGAASTSAVLDIETGSKIDLSVANASPAEGDLTGTLLLRAPQTSGNTDLQMDPINGTITGASSITVEGYAIYNTASDNGSIDDQEGNVFNNGQTFAGNTAAITTRLLAGNAGLASQISSGATSLVVEPGAEIINPSGDLTLANVWDLATYRFGPDNVAGVLTLRAAGNVVFDYNDYSNTGEQPASLSDGFDTTQSPDGLLWDAPLLSTPGAPSWSYRIVAGADFSGANFANLTPLADLAQGSGSLLLGEGAPPLSQSSDPLRSDIIPNFFQTIRTGAGSIQIYAGRDVQLLNSLATIYSAGTQAPPLANFTPPNVDYGSSSSLGSAQTPFYPAQYTEYGGSVTIVAQNDIAHELNNGFGGLMADSSLELPDNWLYRQGAIDPTNGEMDVASTSWWTDFSNFLEGVGAFGGGNLTLQAGDDITNVDAVVPTNAAMPNGIPSAAALVELGGGDLTVSAGNDISGGVYYVERGQGVITAGGQILTNATRATVDQEAEISGAAPDPSTWLPTTLFAGNASFNVSAGGDVLLGPVANPFLLPEGINNSYMNRSYFSTYAATDALNVESLSGNVTIKDSSDGGGSGTLNAWLQAIDSEDGNAESYAATSQPWLRIDDSSTADFDQVTGLMPPTLRVTAFSGSINLVGTLLLSPAADGTLELLSADSINALQINGFDSNSGNEAWGTAVIDLSDADPASIPGIISPISGSQQPNPKIKANPFGLVDTLFDETGSSEGAASVIQTREALHDPGLLHAQDTTPAYLYAAGGDISGMTLYTGKFTDVLASQDITDDAFYLQNVSSSDISVVAAGRDIIPYDPNSPLRLDAQEPGNELLDASQITDSVPGTGSPTAGDIQINGPGTLEVLAGRNLTLGVGSNDPDGTAVGITSIGNARDPYLPFQGAELVVAAGLGGVADGLNDSAVDISKFIDGVLIGGGASGYFADLAATDPSLDVTSVDQLLKLSEGEQAIAALDLFYIVLRDAGRAHDLIGNPDFGVYTAGMAAIKDLLPSFGSGVGDIDVTSKEITTTQGGDIDILDPSGQMTVGVSLSGAQPLEQGIFTEDGGNISIYTEGSVNLGTSRIFSLRGGNIIIWSTTGNIDAGNSSKTVQSAPPTLVIVDPQSADVDTDLAGLATGGGIGVLATVVGVPPGNVDLIAPTGTINAGDAGIRATGNVTLSAVRVLNAFNIQAAGSTTGVPTVVIAAPNLGALSAASSAAGAGSAAATQQVNNQNQQQAAQQTVDSVISVDVIGYGGGEGDDAGG